MSETLMLGRRRLPDVLRRRQNEIAPRHAAGRFEGSPLPFRFRGDEARHFVTK